MMFVLHTKHAYRLPRPLTGISLLYVDAVRTPQETRLGASTGCGGDSFEFLYVDDVRTSQEA
jgi:hypothetical protein